MKVLNYPRTCVGCGLVLLNVFLFAATAAGQLAVNPSPETFGSVQLGNSMSKSAVLSNTGNSSLMISQATVSGTGFSLSGLSMPLTLAPGQAVSVTTTFAPQSSGSTSGSLSWTYSIQKTKLHGKGSPSSISTVTTSLTGTGTTPGQLTANPSSLNFANVQVGSSQTQSATLTNSGGSSLTVSQATLTGSSFTLSGLTLPLTLGAGQSSTFSVVFAPQLVGSVSGNVAFTSDASNPTTNLPLSATGVTQGTLTANPTSLAFGNVQVGNSASLSETLKNTGGSSVTITQASSSVAAFSISGLNLPLTLTANQSVTFTATFAPTSASAASGNLSVASNASNPTLTIALSGTGDLVMTDLRGYGDSSKPADGENHVNYSKRAMAFDQIEVMHALGFEKFAIAGHDRGALVGTDACWTGNWDARIQAHPRAGTCDDEDRPSASTA